MFPGEADLIPFSALRSTPLTVAATSAFAGGVALVPGPPAIVPVQGHDWSGFYAGAMATADQNPAVRRNWDVSGVVYGVDADLANTGNILAGLTVEQRQWEGDTSTVFLGTQSYDPTTLTNRPRYSL